MRALLFLLALLCLGQAGCFEVRYVARQTGDMLHLLRSRRRVADVIADPSTPPLVQQRLRLAMKARQFGIDVLGLQGGAEFTRYIDTHGHLGYNLTVADSTRLHRRSFAAGLLPYLGFLTRESAHRTEAYFQKRGDDTFLREITAFSGMGVLLSPIYSDMLGGPGPSGDLRLVETLLHEMAHTTVPFFLATELNEPFATTVGIHGAALFFLMNQEEGPPQGRRLAASLARASAGQAREGGSLARWLRGELQALALFYRGAQKERWPLDRILRERERRFSEIMARYRQRFPPPNYRILSRGPLNNAVLLSFGVYLAPGAENAPEPQAPKPGKKLPKKTINDERLQEDLLRSVGGDLRQYIALCQQAQGRSHAAAWLRQLAEDYRRDLGASPPPAQAGKLGARP